MLILILENVFFSESVHILDLLYGKKYFWLSKLNSGPIMPVLLGWAVENTDTLFKIHHVVLRGLSGAVLRFSRVSFGFLVQQISFRKYAMLLKTGAKNNGFLRIFG